MNYISGNVINVTFTDYGNTDNVSYEYIVLESEDIPAEESNMIDEHVEKHSLKTIKEEDEGYTSVNSPNDSRKSLNVGEKCIALWGEDNVWYNAQILMCEESGHLVKFVDYGNEDFVPLEHIVMVAGEIPPSGQVDEYVSYN